MLLPKWQRSSRPLESGCPPSWKHFGKPAGGCQYQHAKYSAQLQNQQKRANLRETLERGGVRAPDEIAILGGEPWERWTGANRPRLPFDAQRYWISGAAVARCGCGGI